MNQIRLWDAFLTVHYFALGYDKGYLSETIPLDTRHDTWEISKRLYVWYNHLISHKAESQGSAISYTLWTNCNGIQNNIK